MTPWLPLVITLATVIAAFSLMLWVVSWWLQRGTHRHIAQRLAHATQRELMTFDGETKQDWRHTVIDRGEHLNRWFGDTENESTERLFAQAGWRSLTARTVFYLAQITLPLALAPALATVALAWKGQQLHALLGAVAGFCIGGLLVRRILRAKVDERLSVLRSEIPVFINLLVLLFEAGLGVRQSLSILVQEGRAVLTVLTEELQLVIRQVDSGADLNDTLSACTRTLGVDELQSVIGVLLQVDRYGGEIRQPLLDALKLIEERRSLNLREQVNALSGRMTVAMVLFFFPALLICVAGPAFVSILTAL